MMKLRLLMLVLVALPPPAFAAEPPPPDRAETLVVYGDDPCPEGEGDEIVVCARRPESERYRIPKELREKEAEKLETSWTSRMAVVEEVTRDTWPGGCSVVGSGGNDGCWTQMMRRWRAERQAVPTNP